MAILIAGWAGLAAWIESRASWQGGRPFAPHRADLEVMRPVLEGPNQREAFFITGLLTNHGGLSWRVRTLELRFLNPDGSLLDGMQCPADEPFVIQPRSESAFRVTVGKLPPAVSAARIEARVQDAKDGNLPADPP